jgi:uncharacterized protein YbjT (DUF2867 family)
MTEPTRSTVVVTGAAGYVGRHVVSAVADLGFDAVAVVRPGRAEGVWFKERWAHHSHEPQRLDIVNRADQGVNLLE